MSIGLLGALLGGILTLLSPCSVMLLPAFFSYAFTSTRQVVSRTGVFYLGLITTLVPLGMLAGTVGAFINEYRFVFITVASIVVIVLGLIMVLNLPFLRLPGASGLDGTSGASVYALGTVYGLAGVCAGPLLGAVLTYAAMGANALYGGLVLLVFAAGMAAPLLVLALLWGRIPGIKKLVRPREIRIGAWRTTWTGLIGGLITMGIGIFLLATQGTTSLGGILGATDQVRLEGTVLGAAGKVSDLWVLLGAVVISCGALLAVRLRERRASATTPEGAARD
ncbi:putative integral membrane cytochrome c biogenesis protein [Microbacterium sorbitolivorans]|uniref:Cytochrome c biogenesis protein CcdA n=1 Tax=Microbacterium sorbitolivorans TaxID=1867410 RepID=A0A367Y6B3_9MICO|nr:cytochrome c biogenesis protein CcdA [Microbacterium sorbitolivorans]RCK61396.1 cytochrome c biogenesis protein CcdA [Microbacterium sorbitolivorans]GGF32587.1 putative integral membrane cytochrome c biogenesis protein [Microbacterium sorbitolivorans]